MKKVRRVCFRVTGESITKLYRDFWQEGNTAHAIRSVKVTYPEMDYRHVIGLLTGKYRLTEDTGEGDGTHTLEEDPGYAEYVNDVDYISVDKALQMNLDTIVHASAALAGLCKLRDLLVRKLEVMRSFTPSSYNLTKYIPGNRQLTILDDILNEAMADALGYDYNKAADRFKESIAESVNALNWLAPVSEVTADDVPVSGFPLSKTDEWGYNVLNDIAETAAARYKTLFCGAYEAEKRKEEALVAPRELKFTSLAANTTGSGWIDPSGKVLSIDFSQHIYAAQAIINELLDGSGEDNKDPERVLEEKGWIKMSAKRFYFNGKGLANPTRKQINAIAAWAMDNNQGRVYWQYAVMSVEEFIAEASGETE